MAPALPDPDIGFVLTDQARTLRDQKMPSGQAVIDILGHLRGHKAGLVGADAGDEGRRNDRSGLKQRARWHGLKPLQGRCPRLGRLLEKTCPRGRDGGLNWCCGLRPRTRSCRTGTGSLCPAAEKQATAARRLAFLFKAFALYLFRARRGPLWRNWRRRADRGQRGNSTAILRFEDRLTEIARQRWP